MALIKCKECNKEVSDTAKTCPHCGYKLKSFKLNLKIKNTDLIVLGFIIQVFLLMFVNGTFAREFHSWGDKIVTRISNASFIDAAYALWYVALDVIIIFLGIIAIATILVKIFNKYDLKVLNKIKNNIYVCNVPTIIYAVIILLITLCSELALGVVEGYESKFWYSVRWGGIWMNILSIVAASILVRELVIHIKNKKVREKNEK